MRYVISEMSYRRISGVPALEVLFFCYVILYLIISFLHIYASFFNFPVGRTYTPQVGVCEKLAIFITSSVLEDFTNRNIFFTNCITAAAFVVVG